MFLLFPMGVHATDVYHIRRLSERELLQSYTDLLVDACHHADRFWKTSAFDANAGYWGDGASDGNQGIRAIGEMIFTCGTLLKYVPATGYHPGMAVGADVLYACASDQSRSVKTGDEVARRVVLLLVEVDAEQTATLAKSFRSADESGMKVLSFALPEGGTARVPLL